MNTFNIAERYKLIIRWSKVVSLDDYTIRLEGCYLEGPVLPQLAALQKKDTIRLDFSNQYIILIRDYYIASLSWDGYYRQENKILLDNVVLKNKHIGSVPALSSNDYIVIDTKEHEDEKHNSNLNYKSYLIKGDGALYSFSK